MSQPEIKAGCTVRLKSGSPKLTVVAVKDGHAVVMWFNGTTAGQLCAPLNCWVLDDALAEDQHHE